MTAPAAAWDAGRLHRQVDRLRDLPALPGIVERIAAVLDQADANLAEAAALIETDQVLTAHVLRLANSAFYGLSGRIGSAQQALTVLGTAVSRSIIYATAVLDLRIGLAGFWEHAVGTAVMAGAVARQLKIEKPEEVSGAGLLHDLGKVVLFRQAPDAFDAVLAYARAHATSFRDGERVLLGTDHAEVASWLLTRWRFPVRLTEPVVCHHDPGRARAVPLETAVVHVANTLVRAYGYGFGGDARIPAVQPAAWARLGLDRAGLHAVFDAFERDIGAAHATLALGG